MFVKLSITSPSLMIIYIQYLTLQKKEISRGTTKSKDPNYVLCYANTSAMFNFIRRYRDQSGTWFQRTKVCTVCGKVVKLIINV